MRKTYIILIGVLIILIILGWSPWITDNYVKEKISKNPEYLQIRPSDYFYFKTDIKVNKNHFFGRYAETPDKGWYVTFWGYVYIIFQNN